MRNESEFEIREDIFKKYLPKSYAVITNSELIKKDIVKFYNVDEKRITIVSHQPSSQILNFKHDLEKEIKIIKKYDLPKKFFFYPAQYWPHKNHIYLVDGLEVALKELKFEISAVFCGSDKGNLNFVKETVERFGSQAIVGSIVARRHRYSWEAFMDNAKHRSHKDAIDWALELEQAGVGEIMITSIDNDGRQKGFDEDLVGRLTKRINVPVIVSGGAGSSDDVVQLCKKTNAKF